MLRKLISDTAVTALGLFVTGFVGVLLAPLLMTEYGIVGYGVITLARTLLPTGVLSLFDFGISEIATQTIAAARISNAWSDAKAKLRLAVFLAVLLGVFVSVGLSVFSGQLTEFFKIGENSLVFSNAVVITAAVFPILLVSQVFEGVIKGYEKVLILRGTESVVAILYAFLVIGGIQLEMNLAWPIYSFLGVQTAKSIFFGAVSWNMLPSGNWWEASPDAKDFVFKMGRLLLASRIVGGVQTQFPPILIGATVGPSGVGLYDVISRLPRLGKMGLSIINSSLMPVATKLMKLGDFSRLQLIGYAGITILPALIFPLVAAVAIFSGSIIRLWLGDGFSQNSHWLVIFWLIPALTHINSFQSNALMMLPEYLKKNNKITSAQVVAQILTSLMLVYKLEQNAFVVGQAASTLIFFMVQSQIGCSYFNISKSDERRFECFVFFFIIWIGFAALLMPTDFGITSWLDLVFAFCALLTVLWLVTAFVFLDHKSRSLLRQMFLAAKASVHVRC